MQRGGLTVWLEEAALNGWLEVYWSDRSSILRTYSNAAIQAVLILKAVYHLPLRGA